MKRILLAADNKGVKAATADFACYLTKLTNASLEACFLHMHDYVPVFIEDDETGSAKTGSESNAVDRFIAACASKAVDPLVYCEPGLGKHTVLSEAKFSDVLIFEAAISDISGQASSVSSVAADLLHKSLCPVMVAPLSFEKLEHVIFAYDGSDNSIYAIRQFMQLFPELYDRKITVLQIFEHADSDLVTEQFKLKKWLGCHYSDISFITLEGDVLSRLLEYTLGRQHSIVVAGGYSRGWLSRLLHPSASELLVNMLSSPLFIAHR